MNEQEASPHVSPARRSRRALYGWLRGVFAVPAVRFVLGGALLFAAHARWGSSDTEPLVLTRGEQRALRERFRQQRGREPKLAERRALWEQWAEQEAMVRHARELRLDEHDAVVRRRLIQDVEFLLEAEAPVAGEAELLAYYDTHRERFVSAPRRDFEHVFVRGTDSAASARAASLYRRLTQGAEAQGLGDPSVHGQRLLGVSAQRLTVLYGADFAQRAFALPIGSWSAPLASPVGLHLLRVTDEGPAGVRSFEQVRGLVEQQHAAEARRAALERGRRALRVRYRLVVP